MPTASKAPRRPRKRTAPRRAPAGRPRIPFISLAAAALLVGAAMGIAALVGPPRSPVGPGTKPVAERPPMDDPRPPSETDAPPIQTSRRGTEAEAGPRRAAPERRGPGPESGAAEMASEIQRLSKAAPPSAEAGREGPRSSDVLPASYRDRVPRPRPRAAPAKVLIVVIDDAGNGMSQLEPFLRLPFPLTIAVLPRLPHSAEAAAAVRAAGKELILHQPMQAIGGQDPGPGAIRLGTPVEEVRRVVSENLRGVPGAVGMNNHMGSAVTTDLGLMEAVAAVAKARGIYYLDSLTISGTATEAAAHREGIRYWERAVFLDNVPDKASILRAVEDGKKRAAKGGSAVMIGHVWSADLAQTLMDLYPQLVEEGFSLSTISRFMMHEAVEDDASPGN